MINDIMKMFLTKSEDYAKIFIVIWLKLREIYLLDNNDKVSLNKKVESLSKFCRTIRKRCYKAKKLPNFSKFLKRIENECKNSKQIIEKLGSITMILKMFDLPKPIEKIIDSLGLVSNDDNEFANVINELFDENVELEKIEEQPDLQEQEGTLIDYINKKYDKNNPEKIIEERYVKVEKPTITEIQNIVIEKNVVPAKKVTIDTSKTEEKIYQFSSLENNTRVNYKSLEIPKNLGYYQGNYIKNNRGDINESILRNYYMAGNTRFENSYNRNNLNR